MVTRVFLLLYLPQEMVTHVFLLLYIPQENIIKDFTLNELYNLGLKNPINKKKKKREDLNDEGDQEHEKVE